MGPLRQLRVVEFAGLGAAPFCAMLLADLGADVLRIDRADARGKGSRFEILNRGRRSVALDLKNPRAVAAVLRLVAKADVVLEGFRPGVMERLGVGPEECARVNPRLVFGRLSGWGQEGPLARAAGHDINFISLAGVLGAIGPKGEKPVAPLNLVGDYAGGMLMAFGLIAAVLEARTSGVGQVVDGAMLDAAALTMNRFLGLWAEGKWTLARGANYLDGGAHFYDTYACSDGKYVAVGALEPQFYRQLLDRLGMREIDPARQFDRSSWDAQKAELAAVFARRTRDEWCRILEGSDVCIAPVLGLDEVSSHPHNAARKTFADVGGVIQAAPAPRFSRTPPELGLPPPIAGEHDREALRGWGFDDSEIGELRRAHAFGRAD